MDWTGRQTIVAKTDKLYILIDKYRLVNKYMPQSSEAFPRPGDECGREVLGPEPRFYTGCSTHP
jgi:hypothetical protein